MRKPSKSFRQKCGMSSCVLCSNSIGNNCDKNLVDGRKGTAFKVRAEILTLDYRVPINSPYICRSCLALLKKRRVLVTSLEEVNSKLHNVVIVVFYQLVSHQVLNQIFWREIFNKSSLQSELP